MATHAITPGTFIVCGDGHLDRVTGTVRRNGEPARFIVADRSEWIAGECRSATLHDFQPAGRCYERHGAASSREGFTIACSCTQLWGGSNWVRTPCCQKGRRGVEAGDTVICPGCGWYWAVYIAPGGTCWVSMGFGKAMRRQYTRGATGRAIGTVQYDVLQSLASHNGGEWWPSCGWSLRNTSTTVRHLKGLARAGLVEDVRRAEGHVFFRITDAGRGELPAPPSRAPRAEPPRASWR
ncbi:hypothetical protein ACWD4N_47665 [Streptomyces sp. NPDC002586]